MLPRRLRLEGFRSFGELDLDLPLGCVALTGANGAGKSSVVDAIDVALFGPDGRSFDPYLRVGATRLELELELEHRGELYRVRRIYNGRRATLDLERFDDGADPREPAWRTLSQGTVADTQAMLERELGLTRETLRASAILRQGAGGAFTEAQPKDRKRILADVLALSVWGEAAQRVAGDRRACEANVAGLEGAVASLRERVAERESLERQAEVLAGQLADADQALAGAVELVASTDEAHKAAVERETRRRIAEAELAQARTLLEALEVKVANAEGASLALGEARERERNLNERAERRAALLTQVQVAETAAGAYETAHAQRRDLVRLGDELRPRIGSLEARRFAIVEAEVPRCDACGQPLDTASKTQALETIDRERADVERRLDALRSQHDAIVLPPAPDLAELDALRSELKATDDVPALLASTAATIATLEAQAAAHTPEVQAELELAKANVETKREALETVAEGAEHEVAARAKVAHLEAVEAERLARTRRDGAAREQATLAGRLEAVAADAAALDERLERLTEARARLDDLEVLERAFGRDGVPSWIVERHALPAIENEANRLLTVLGGPVERLELRTSRELKTGGSRDDALDIVCVTVDGDRDYSSFSGGERTRVNLALRIALARLLAHRRDADVRLLAIDEPDGLDEQGMSALVDVLRELVDRGEFTTALLASHVPALRDAFDTSLRVERDEATSVSRVTVS